jgi:branched-chain amino acid transport system ATP-binding protein
MTAPPLLRIEGLGKSFGRLSVLQEVSFSVGAGEALGIVGPNGAGKSTLLNLVGGVTRPDAGRVHFDGQDITTLAAADRCRKGISRSYQIPRPFVGMTVYENTLVPATFGSSGPAQAREHAIAALEKTGLLKISNEQAGSLRLLDRKRLELARALACQPRMVLLDEIAGGLTDSEVPELVSTILGLKEEGVAVVWIEHVVRALLAVADRMMCLAQGRVIAVGTPHDVMQDARVREVYLGTDPGEVRA